MSLLANSNAIETGGYPIQRSLRFRSSASAYLSRTPASAGNRQTWTYSFWFKRGALSSQQIVFDAGTGNSSDFRVILQAGDVLETMAYNGASYDLRLVTTQVFRDSSAWYHAVIVADTTNATAANRIKLYINGSQVTSLSTATYPVQNYNTYVNATNAHAINGYSWSTGSYTDGYLAEVNFIDGQALTPSSFGETDAVTGVWQPKKYTGTYGTNGFYLPFSDNTSATTLAYDKSGNGNNWTPNNISTTAGATYDSMTDVPTLTSATAANFAVINPIKTPATNNTTSNGNLTVSTDNKAYATQAVTSGKWYWECKWDSGLAMAFGVAGANATAWITSANSGLFYYFDGTKWINGANTAYGSAFTTSDLIGVALDVDSGTVTFYKNNVSQGDITLSSMPDAGWTPCTMSGNATNVATFNFGQRPFSYTPPAGFKALNTFNLPDPTIKKPNQYMDATTYTGTGSALSVTNAAGFQPDFVWVKGRSGATDHALYDAVRGIQNQLESNTTTAETTETTGLTAFNSNGFSVGALAQMNTNTATYVGWQWKGGGTAVTNTAGSITSQVSANPSAGFSIVKHTNTGAPATIGHGLGIAPKLIINKVYSRTENWRVYFGVANKYLILNSTNAEAIDANIWNNTQPTSSVFSIGTYFSNGDNIISYCFAEIAGFSKFGSYTGNGSADGPFVYCGFRPKYVMVKRVDLSTDWFVRDSIRSTYNVIDDTLYPNLSNAEETANELSIDFTSNGFKIRNGWSSLNASGGTYIYAAFAENPFKYSNAR